MLYLSYFGLCEYRDHCFLKVGHAIGAENVAVDLVLSTTPAAHQHGSYRVIFARARTNFTVRRFALYTVTSRAVTKS